MNFFFVLLLLSFKQILAQDISLSSIIILDNNIPKECGINILINDNKNKRGLFHYDSNIVPHVASALVKGRWNLSEYPELVDILSENKIDYNLRGSV